MKTVCSLIFSLLIVMLIASCGSTGPDSDETFEPYRIGDFLMVSPTKAELQERHLKVGTPAVMGDTTLVTSLDQKGLTVKMDTLPVFGDIYSGIELVDSTANGLPINFDYTQISSLEAEGFTNNGMSYFLSSDYTKTQFNYTYTCGTALPTEYSATITYFDEDSTHLKSYEFRFTGLNQVLETINDCP